MVDSALHGWCVRLRNAGRGGIVERGLLSTSDQEWAEARRRSAVIGPLAAMGGVGHQAADAAAEQLGLSRRQVYVLVKYLSPALHQCTRERRILAVGTRCTRIYG